MTPEIMTAVRRNAASLVEDFRAQMERLRFVRSVDDCLQNEAAKLAELAESYSGRLSGVKFLNAAYFSDHNEFVRHQEIDERYFMRGCRDYFFVSHRWATREHPDPSATHFGLVRERLSRLSPEHREATGLWFDFSCIPQRNSLGRRSSAEDAEFASALEVMHLLASGSNMLGLFDSEYLDRAWCLTEWVFASRLSPVPVDGDRGRVPFGNILKFRQMALLVAFLRTPWEMQEPFIAGRDETYIGLLNSLLTRMTASSEAAFADDKVFIFEVMHRYFWYHMRFLGMRSQLMLAFLLLDRFPDEVLENAFGHFLFLTEDPELSWTKEILIHVDTMLLDEPDPFQEVAFHGRRIQVVPRARIADPEEAAED